MANVLFVCLHNAGRSQMSRALFERAAGARHRADSAGTHARRADSSPGARGHARARDRPLHITPKRLEREQAEWADLVVTMGCGDECPYVPGTRYVDWELPDPAGRSLEEVRGTRDEIARRVNGLLAELDGEGT